MLDSSDFLLAMHIKGLCFSKNLTWTMGAHLGVSPFWARVRGMTSSATITLQFYQQLATVTPHRHSSYVGTTLLSLCCYYWAREKLCLVAQTDKARSKLFSLGKNALNSSITYGVDYTVPSLMANWHHSAINLI